MNEVSRKDFVAILGTATAAAAVPSAAGAAPPSAEATVAQAAPAAPTAPGLPSLGTEPEAYTFFSAPEAAVIEAAVERLIPTDSLGPGAKSAGVAFFIDQQLVGAYGTGAKTYRSGPWLPGTPTQGYQLRQTPAELYRQAIAALEAYCNKTYQTGFAKLTAAQQDTVLKGLDGGTIAFDLVPARVWFNMLLQNTQEGFFSDPLYGGNRDKVGWKLLGFPGVPAYYADKIGKHNVPYNVPPVSIADIQQGKPVAAGHITMHQLAAEHAARLNEENG
jgi:gluconate 2-dehydrogenase gamma chain